MTKRKVLLHIYKCHSQWHVDAWLTDNSGIQRWADCADVDTWEQAQQRAYALYVYHMERAPA